MVTPGFHATRFVRPVLLTITLYFSSFAIAEALPLGMVAFQEAYFTGASHSIHYNDATGACTDTYNSMNLSASVTNLVYKNGKGIVDYDGTLGYGSTYGCLTDIYRYYDNSLWQENYFETGRIELYQSCPLNSRIHQVIGWPSLGDGCVCIAADGYVPDTTGTSCVLPSACPTHASGTPCACDAGYQFDAAGTSCVPVTCPVPLFPELLATDLCTQSLEKGKGKDVDLACGPLDPEMVNQAQCLADKIHSLAIPYTEPSATVRTEVYQQHFVDIWKWHKKIDKDSPTWSDAEKQACAPTVAKVKAEMDKHQITGEPSSSGSDAPHVQRKAVDIDRAVVNAMKEIVTNTTFVLPENCFLTLCQPVYIGDVQDYVNSTLVNPPPCKLRWGGRFEGKKFDPVHFDLFLP